MSEEERAEAFRSNGYQWPPTHTTYGWPPTEVLKATERANNIILFFLKKLSF